MKRLTLIFLILSLTVATLLSNSQIHKELIVTDSIPVDSSLIIKYLEQQIELNKVKIEAQSDKIDSLLYTSSTDRLGQVILHKNFVVNNSGDTLNVLSVEFFLKNGTLKHIRLLSSENRTYESNKVFSFNGINKQLQSVVLKNTINDDEEVSINGLFEARIDLDLINFVPSDGIYILSSNNPTINLEVGTDINSFVNFNVYTDILGLTNTQENGIVQSEFTARIPLTSTPLGGSGVFSMLDYVEANVRYSRLDSSDQYVVLNRDPPFFPELLEIRQKSHFGVSAYMNVLRGYLFQNSFEYLTLGIGLSLTNGTETETNSIKQIPTYSRYLRTGGELLRYKNFGMNYSITAEFMQILDSDLFGGDRPTFVIGVFESQVFYNPINRQENKVFLRFQSVSSQDDIIGFGTGHYFTLQFGYKARLGSISNKKAGL